MNTTDPMPPTHGARHPAPPASGRQSLRPWATGLVLIGVALVIAGVLARSVQLPYDTLAPGGVQAVNRVVSVQGHAIFPPVGKVFSVTVSVRERVNPYEAMAGWLDPSVEVIPETQVRGTVTPDQYLRQNVQAMTDSKTTAEVLALRQLGITDLGVGAEVVDVEAGRPAASVLKANDVIVAVDATATATSGDALSAIQAHAPGDRLTMDIQRGDGAPSEVEVVLGQGDGGRPLLGVRMSTKIRLPFDVKIDSGNVVGPSAGLAYGLELLDLLTPGELTGGSSVAATGELLSDGTVGPIGGIAQKTVAVRRAGIKVFLVPKENESEARAHAGATLLIRGVTSFEDALHALGALAGSNALALGRPGPGA